jgi:hypothetical protein
MPEIIKIRSGAHQGSLQPEIKWLAETFDVKNTNKTYRHFFYDAASNCLMVVSREQVRVVKGARNNYMGDLEAGWYSYAKDGRNILLVPAPEIAAEYGSAAGHYSSCYRNYRESATPLFTEKLQLSPYNAKSETAYMIGYTCLVRAVKKSRTLNYRHIQSLPNDFYDVSTFNNGDFLLLENARRAMAVGLIVIEEDKP